MREPERAALEGNPFLLTPENIDGFLKTFPKIHLEIGFGAGEHLLARAVEHPQIGFIGAEAYVNGVAKCARDAIEEGVTNLRIWPQDARPLLDQLSAASLDVIYLLYPDPWPKRRHWKRRMINDMNLARFARLLKPGGQLYFATDWANYAAWALSHFLRAKDFKWEAQDARDWQEPFPHWPSTRYEKKALQEQRAPSYLAFIRS